MSGIASYGVYIPYTRIKTEEIASTWGKNPSEIIGALKVTEKSVPAFDEDTVTISHEAGIRSLAMGDIAPEKIQAVFVGSESHPYAVNPTATIVGELLGIGPQYFASDLEFACKAGTTGMQLVYGLLESKKIKYGLAIGADTAQAKPADILEYSAATAATSFILTSIPSEIIATIITTSSYCSDTPDFWRRDGQKHPSHAGRFTGEPAF
jgi:hydroxymethylglutaryl-CoA synthase